MNTNKTAYWNLQDDGSYDNPDHHPNSDFTSINLSGHEFNTILAFHVGSIAAAKSNDSFSLHFWGGVNVKIEVVNGTFYFNDRRVGEVAAAVKEYMRLCYEANKDPYVFIPGFPFGMIKAEKYGGFWFIIDMQTKHSIGEYRDTFEELVEYAQSNYTGDYR